MNKYEVINRVGEGAYGIVLKCRNKDTGEIVAIKKFKESEDDEIVRKTTTREVKILRALRSMPSIVHLREAFRRKGRLYLVFEYVGCNLLELLEENPKGLPSELVRRYAFMLIQAIHACHSSSVIHRDIKPENLLINSFEQTLKLCDFGFARFMAPKLPDGGDPEYTDYVATRWYRSPELLLGSTFYTEKVDIWAIGCIVCEMIDGQALFPGESEVDQLFLVQKMFGNYDKDQTDMFFKCPRFAGYTLPNVSRPETLEKRFLGRASKKALMLLKRLLQLTAVRRGNSAEAVSDLWFEGIDTSQPVPVAYRPRREQSAGSDARRKPVAAFAVPGGLDDPGGLTTDKPASQPLALAQPQRASGGFAAALSSLVQPAQLSSRWQDEQRQAESPPHAGTPPPQRPADRDALRDRERPPSGTERPPTGGSRHAPPAPPQPHPAAALAPASASAAALVAAAAGWCAAEVAREQQVALQQQQQVAAAAAAAAAVHQPPPQQTPQHTPQGKHLARRHSSRDSHPLGELRQQQVRTGGASAPASAGAGAPEAAPAPSSVDPASARAGASGRIGDSCFIWPSRAAAAGGAGPGLPRPDNLGGRDGLGGAARDGDDSGLLLGGGAAPPASAPDPPAPAPSGRGSRSAAAAAAALPRKLSAGPPALRAGQDTAETTRSRHRQGPQQGHAAKPRAEPKRRTGDDSGGVGGGSGPSDDFVVPGFNEHHGSLSFPAEGPGRPFDTFINTATTGSRRTRQLPKLPQELRLGGGSGDFAHANNVGGPFGFANATGFVHHSNARQGAAHDASAFTGGPGGRSGPASIYGPRAGSASVIPRHSRAEDGHSRGVPYGHTAAVAAAARAQRHTRLP